MKKYNFLQEKKYNLKIKLFSIITIYFFESEIFRQEKVWALNLKIKNFICNITVKKLKGTQ